MGNCVWQPDRHDCADQGCHILAKILERNIVGGALGSVGHMRGRSGLAYAALMGVQRVGGLA